MNLVNDDKTDVPNIPTMLPVTTNPIPLLRGRYKNTRAIQRLDIRCEVTSQLHHLLSKDVFKTLSPILDTLLGEGLQRGNVDCLLSRVVVEKPEQSKLSGYRFPRAGRRSYQGISIIMV